ncbi:MAG: hypothetical protein RIB30_08750 [Thalassospira sp.]|uniref:hypothetical protein n=1 Tax=Thalassospira sp. TaxID=1912094 RepID=UPI0032EF2CF8
MMYKNYLLIAFFLFLFLGVIDWIFFRVIFLEGNEFRLANLILLIISIFIGYFSSKNSKLNKNFYDVIVFDSGGSKSLGKIYVIIQFIVLFISITIFAFGELIVIFIFYMFYSYISFGLWGERDAK